jgi:hypothetical protein
MAVRTPSQSELLERAVRKGLIAAHAGMPGEVVAVDLQAGTVDVKPRLQIPVLTAAGELTGESIPVLRKVPIVFYSGGGFSFTMPVAAGDSCWLSFADFAMDEWKGQGQESAPIDLRSHHLADAVAIFALRPFSKPLQVDADAASFGKDGGLRVKVKDSTIELGGATDAVALASKVDAQLGALKTALNSWVPVPSDGGAALKTILTALFATWPAGVGSATIKGKD